MKLRNGNFSSRRPRLSLGNTGKKILVQKYPLGGGAAMERAPEVKMEGEGEGESERDILDHEYERSLSFSLLCDCYGKTESKRLCLEKKEQEWKKLEKILSYFYYPVNRKGEKYIEIGKIREDFPTQESKRELALQK